MKLRVYSNWTVAFTKLGRGLSVLAAWYIEIFFLNTVTVSLYYSFVSLLWHSSLLAGATITA